MAHPKRRQSKTRTLKRRTHDKAVAPTLAITQTIRKLAYFRPPDFYF